MRFYLTLIFFISQTAWANDEILLQDSDCKILSSDTMNLQVFPGTLTNFVCRKINNSITCSITAEGGSMYGHKPSTINIYNEFPVNDKVLLWRPSDYEGLFILNLLNKKYSATSMQIINGMLVNKHCVGDIKQY